jgi:hypothetical protein
LIFLRPRVELDWLEASLVPLASVEVVSTFILFILIPHFWRITLCEAHFF